MEKLKDKKFAFRVRERDLNQIRLKAKRAKMTVTDYLVASSLGKDIIVIDGVEPLIGQLKAVGKNLNQLPTLAHMGRIETVRLDEVSEAFGNIVSALNSLTREGK